MSDDYGKPLFEHLRHCVRCCMPETAPNIQFDEMGICKACRSSEMKMHINWKEREKALRKILDNYKSKAGNNYDCLIPISGGKDSIFQLHILVREYGMKPLACTWNHNWYSEPGKRNLQTCLEKLNVDHIMFTPNRALINKLARRSLHLIGDACWHCHIGVEAFPLQVAVRWNIPLMIYGESVAEHSGKATYEDNPTFDYDYFLKQSAKVRPEEMLDRDITEKDLHVFKYPSLDELAEVGVTRIFLGDYMFWDLEKQTELMVKEYGWEEDDVEGTYKRYKSVECIMPGVHDYAKFIKRGYGRATDFASLDVRAGVVTREEGFELAKKIDPKRPKALDYYLEITGMSEDEFYEALIKLRDDKARDLPTSFPLGKGEDEA